MSPAPERERNRLSPREANVLRLATLGWTDQQIANELRIKVSTVSTYWIRIRSKLGPLNRSELIAAQVRNDSNVSLSNLREQLDLRTQELSEARATSMVLSEAIGALPVGVVIVEPAGNVTCSNTAACRMLSKSEAEMSGTTLDELLRNEENLPARVELKALDKIGPGWSACLLFEP